MGIHARIPELVDEVMTKRKTQCIVLSLSRGSKISSYFLQKRSASAIQFQWNQIIRHTLKTPADVEMNLRVKEIADQELEARWKKPETLQLQF